MEKPIFNHSYTKLPRGPVPTWLYSIVRTSISGGNYDAMIFKKK